MFLVIFKHSAASNHVSHGPSAPPRAHHRLGSQGPGAIPGQNTPLRNITKIKWPLMGDMYGKGKTERQRKFNPLKNIIKICTCINSYELSK